MACGIALRDFERGAPASLAVGLGTLVLAAVLHHDFHELPEKAYQAFGIGTATFPEGFKDTALALWWVVLGGFGCWSLLTWAEAKSERTPFEPSNYTKVVSALRTAYDGALVFVYLAVVAGAALAALIVFAGVRSHATWLPQMSSTVRDVVLNAWWCLAFIPLGVLLGAVFAGDLWLWGFGRSRPLSRASLLRGIDFLSAMVARLLAKLRSADRKAAPLDESLALAFTILAIPALALGIGILAGQRAGKLLLLVIFSAPLVFGAVGLLGDLVRTRAAAMVFGGAAVGFVLCFSYYPALANQLSPKEVFESYRRVCPGAPLALLGVGGRTSAYYAGGQPQTFSDSTSAFQWLVAGGGQRRCLALKAEELPKLNQLWREHEHPRTNVPVLDARSSQILLVASTLGEGEKDENPLSSMVLSAPPHPQRRLDAHFEDKLVALGIDVVDERDRLVESVSPGRTYHMRTYYQVLAPVSTEWESFIHIDGYHRRHNGDHKPLGGKYPMALWLPGDELVDDYEFKLEPNFTPGTYTIYFGLWVGDTRLKVVSGPSDGENRVNGGALRVQ
jgi:hypothetical protein